MINSISGLLADGKQLVLVRRLFAQTANNIRPSSGQNISKLNHRGQVFAKFNLKVLSFLHHVSVSNFPDLVRAINGCCSSRFRYKGTILKQRAEQNSTEFFFWKS